jgi:hydrogenase nickel incorporation protein HypA/HybF
MHELSIALSIVDVAQEHLQGQCPCRVETVQLRLGPLSGVVKEALLSAYELATEGSPLAGSTLEIEDVPVEIQCEKCGKPQPVKSVWEMTCAQCGTPSANIVHGRELEVVSMEICDEPAAAAS